MATKESAGTLSKSDAVREYLSSHREAPVKQVAAALADQGIEVSIALVNKVKYGGGKTLRRRRAAGPKRPHGKAVANPASKAQAIRQALGELGRTARPRDIISHLKHGGVDVTAAQVSAIRKRFRSAKSRSASAALAGNLTTEGISLEHLLAAKRLADELGLEAAKKALDVLGRLES